MALKYPFKITVGRRKYRIGCTLYGEPRFRATPPHGDRQAAWAKGSYVCRQQKDKMWDQHKKERWAGGRLAGAKRKRRRK